MIEGLAGYSVTFGLAAHPIDAVGIAAADLSPSLLVGEGDDLVVLGEDGRNLGSFGFEQSVLDFVQEYVAVVLLNH